MTLRKGETWYVCRKRDAVFRVEVTKGIVVAAAPIARWSEGQPVEKVLRWTDEYKKGSSLTTSEGAL